MDKLDVLKEWLETSDAWIEVEGYKAHILVEEAVEQLRSLDYVRKRGGKWVAGVSLQEHEFDTLDELLFPQEGTEKS